MTPIRPKGHPDHNGIDPAGDLTIAPAGTPKPRPDHRQLRRHWQRRREASLAKSPGKPLRAPHATRRRRDGKPPLQRDGPAAVGAVTATIAANPDRSRGERGEFTPVLVEQPADLRPLERDRLSLGVVLVVRRTLLGRGRDLGEAGRQRLDQRRQPGLFGGDAGDDVIAFVCRHPPILAPGRHLQFGAGIGRWPTQTRAWHSPPGSRLCHSSAR